MRITWLKRSFLQVLVLLFLAQLAFSQRMRINTDEIESLIDEWNFANNSRNLHSFRKVYADRITFYMDDMSEAEVIRLKQQLFRENRHFRQRIVTEIDYKPYSEGVVKCDFTKEVLEKNGWKKYPSYLLVRHDNNHYAIVGESDYKTDGFYKQGVTDPVTIEQPEESASILVERDTTTPDSIEAESALSLATRAPVRDTGQATLRLKDFASVLSNLSSLGMITVPKGYVFVLVAMLFMGALMIFVADSLRSRRRGHQTTVERHDKAEHVVRNFKMQSGFESFVITLFDPLYFRFHRPKSEHVYAGRRTDVESGPDLVFTFNQKDDSIRFAIKCQYYKHVAKNEVQLFSAERRRQFEQFEKERGMDVYYVLGFGGQPDDPRELFFVPAKGITSEYVTRTELKSYSKSGMFYYNRRTGRIQ